MTFEEWLKENSFLLEDEDGAPYPSTVQEICNNKIRLAWLAGFNEAHSTTYCDDRYGPNGRWPL